MKTVVVLTGGAQGACSGSQAIDEEGYKHAGQGQVWPIRHSHCWSPDIQVPNYRQHCRSQMGFLVWGKVLQIALSLVFKFYYILLTGFFNSKNNILLDHKIKKICCTVFDVIFGKITVYRYQIHIFDCFGLMVPFKNLKFWMS